MRVHAGALSFSRMKGNYSIVLIIIIGLLNCGTTLSEETNSTKEYEVCKSANCRSLGLEIKLQLEDEKLICKDFYKFVCNKWHLLNPVPSRVWWDQFIKVEDSWYTYMEEVLETDGPDDFQKLRAAKQYHHSCMNIDEIKSEGVQPILDLLKTESSTWWPLLEPEKEWQPTNQTSALWKKAETFYSSLAAASNFFSVGVVSKNGTYILSLDKPEFLIPTEILVSDSPNAIFQRTAYKNMIKDIISEIRANKKSPSLTEEISHLLEFEIQLAKIIVNPENVKKSDVITVGDFQKYYDDEVKFSTYWSSRGLPAPEAKAQKCVYKLNWLDQFRTVLSVTDTEDLHEYTPMFLSSSFYFSDLCELLETTPDNVILNYVYWSIVSKALPYAEGKLRDIAMAVAKNVPLNGFQTDGRSVKRHDKCMYRNKLKDAIFYKVLQNYFPLEMDDKVLDIVRDIELEARSGFSAAFNTKYSPQMQHIVRYKAPELYKNLEGLTIIPFECNHTNYQLQRYAQRRYEAKHKVFKLLESSRIDTRNRWVSIPWTTRVKSEIKWKDNAIEIPAMSLLPPFYDMDFPLSYVYGAFGVQVAHHATELLNRYFSGLRGKSHRAEHLRMVNCYRRQVWGDYTGNTYETLTTIFAPPPKKIQDPTTKHLWTHKIQDALGLETAFKAYQKRMKKTYKGSDMRLPGLEKFTNEQLFYIGYANAFCEVPAKWRPKESPWEDRSYVNADMVDMAIMNNNDFGRVFNCKTGTPMNPAKKCKYWVN